MTNIEWRLYRLEQQQIKDEQIIAGLQSQVAQLKQQMWSAGGGSGGGGGGTAFYTAYPTGAVAGATWAGGVVTAGVSFSAVVTRNSGAAIANLGTQTCWNWLAAGLVANQGIVVIPDDNGEFGTASQSCT